MSITEGLPTVLAPRARGDDLAPRVHMLTAAELEAILRRGEPAVILDVRRREAWVADPARVPGAVWLPLEEVPQRARGLATDAHLIAYCS